MINIANAADHVEVDPKDELAKKKEEVRRISNLCSDYKNFSSKFCMSLLVGFAAYVIVLSAMYQLLKHTDLQAYAPFDGLLVGVLLGAFPFACCIVVLMVASSLIREPDTTQILALLGQYDPVDRAAYQLLQQQTREDGNLDIDNVKAWVKAETAAIQRGSLGPEADVFLSKKV